MSQEIINVLDNLGEKFGIAIDWTSKNIMPYLQDLIHRMAVANILQNILIAIAGIICLVVSAKIYKFGKKQKEDKEYGYWEWGDEGLGYLIAIIMLLFIGVVFTIGGIDYAIQNIFIPEVTVINYLTNLGG